jgi:hypothetical protein
MTRRFLQRAGLLVGLGSGVAMPGQAQLNSLPVYVSPKGGTGFTVAGDYGRGANDDSRKRTSWSARARLGISALTLTAGIGTVNPVVQSASDDRENQPAYLVGAEARVMGGTVSPLAVSLFGGVGSLSYDFDGQSFSATDVPLGVGFGLNLPTPGLDIDPWVAPRLAIHRVEFGGASNTQTGFGVSAGLSLGFASGFGVHGAVDWAHLGADQGDVNLGEAEPLIVGFGIHYRFRIVPLR